MSLVARQFLGSGCEKHGEQPARHESPGSGACRSKRRSLRGVGCGLCRHGCGRDFSRCAHPFREGARFEREANPTRRGGGRMSEISTLVPIEPRYSLPPIEAIADTPLEIRAKQERIARLK